MRTLAAIALALVLASCERPFVDVRPPDIEILEPDPSRALPQAQVLVRVRATSFRGVGRVTVNGENAEPGPGDTWTHPVKLLRGLNEIVIEAYDPEEVPTVDTLRLLRMDLGRAEGPTWAQATGGHSATSLGDGLIFLAGGAFVAGGSATDATWILDVRTWNIAPGPRLVHARTGHTATLLPDGRVVVIGGSSTDEPASVADLVETVEIMDAFRETMVPATTAGDPVRRAYHTAVLRTSPSGPIVDVIGGTGDVRYGAEPRLDVRDDLRSFRVVGDTVRALVPWHGEYIDAMTGHTQTALHDEPAGDRNEFLLSGALFVRSAIFPTNWILDTRTSPGIRLVEIPAPDPPRTGHAATRLGDGRVLLVGGTTPEQSVSGNGAVFLLSVGRFFVAPETTVGTPAPRRRHTATLLPDSRILLMGGFHAGGAAETHTDLLYID